MKKFLSVMLMAAMVFSLCGCMYMEDHFTLNKDGSGNLYSYVLIEKEVYDSLIGAAGSMMDESLTGGALLNQEGGELPVVTVDGVEYCEMEQSQDYATLDELKTFLEGSYEDVRVKAGTIAFKAALDEEDLDGMTFEEMEAAYGEMGIDINTAIEGYFVFHMPEPVVSTTGELQEDGSTVIYQVNMRTLYDGMDIFVTTSEEEAANEKIRNGIKNTKITLKSSLTSKGKIKLAWKKSGGYKVDYYEVFRSTKKNSGYGTKAYYKTSSGSKTSYTNSKVKSGTRYYYRVRGVRVVDGEKIYTPYSNKANRKAK